MVRKRGIVPRDLTQESEGTIEDWQNLKHHFLCEGHVATIEAAVRIAPLRISLTIWDTERRAVDTTGRES
jgi:hypothetical protein